ncbi:hypothetical protein Tco_1561672 [Tanacetum coccineum]
MEILLVSTSNNTAVGGSSKLNPPDHSLTLAKSDASPHAHTQALKVNHSTSRLLLLNKNVISQKAQVHVKFSNSDNHELLHHQRYLKSIKESSSMELLALVTFNRGDC